ncbi:MAG: DUF507 family protein [Myxococcales bacterium]|nr:DUF507 family protein [Myxococcales bacterium]
MRLYASRVPMIAQEVVRHLVDKQLIDVAPENINEVELDAESVLKEYLRAERQLTEQAKDLAHERGLDYSAHQKIKRQLAERAKFGLYEDAVGYIANQLIETFLHTRHVDEIFAADNELRSAIAPLIRRQMSSGDELDAEVRKRIKNLQEGTQDWEIRYQQTLERLKVARGLTDE